MAPSSRLFSPSELGCLVNGRRFRLSSWFLVSPQVHSSSLALVKLEQTWEGRVQTWLHRHLVMTGSRDRAEALPCRVGKIRRPLLLGILTISLPMTPNCTWADVTTLLV